MKLSHLAETLIGSEIIKLAGEIKEKQAKGEKIYNFTIGDFDPKVFPIPWSSRTKSSRRIRINTPTTLRPTVSWNCAKQLASLSASAKVSITIP